MLWKIRRAVWYGDDDAALLVLVPSLLCVITREMFSLSAVRAKAVFELS